MVGVPGDELHASPGYRSDLPHRRGRVMHQHRYASLARLIGGLGEPVQGDVESGQDDPRDDLADLPGGEPAGQPRGCQRLLGRVPVERRSGDVPAEHRDLERVRLPGRDRHARALGHLGRDVHVARPAAAEGVPGADLAEGDCSRADRLARGERASLIGEPAAVRDRRRPQAGRRIAGCQFDRDRVIIIGSRQGLSGDEAVNAEDGGRALQQVPVQVGAHLLVR